MEGDASYGIRSVDKCSPTWPSQGSIGGVPHPILPRHPSSPNMTTRITISQVLRVPAGEIAFTYPRDARPSQIDKKYETLRVERRGLRRWNSFQENPACLQAYLDRHSAYPEGWRPYVTAWQRYAASERIVQDLYGLTVIHRVNVALDAAVPGQQLSIIGTPKHFPSWGTETSRPEGGKETRIAPDWVVVYGDSTRPCLLADLDEDIIAWGDTKLIKSSATDTEPLPDTVACPEAHLAQVVQYCIDMAIPLGFVLTNNELIVFHLVKSDDGQERQTVTRTSHLGSSAWQHLPSDATEEPDFSSPVQRKTRDWVRFDEGDHAIPVFTCKDNKLESPSESESTFAPGRDGDEHFSPAPRQVSRTLLFPAHGPSHTTPEPPNSQQSFLDPDSPCPDTRGHGDRPSTTNSPEPPSEAQTTSQLGFSPDVRAEDPTHVLIKVYPADDEGIAQRLFELCMLAKAAKDSGALGIGPWKLSFTSYCY
ncbi:hypothetical protein CHU98_g9105 [Xylaria longipes]|nr:hypothetical protein CHU98_g9105 [Xylaria longipes]